MDLTAACGGNHGGEDIPTVAHVGPHSGADGLFPEGTVWHGEPTLEKGVS